MKVGERSINFSDEVKQMDLDTFTKYWNDSGHKKRTGVEAEEVHVKFKVSSKKK